MNCNVYYVIMMCCVLTGYQCEQHNNPADFLLDVIIENEGTDNNTKGIKLCYLPAVLYHKYHLVVGNSRNKGYPMYQMLVIPLYHFRILS